MIQLGGHIFQLATRVFHLISLLFHLVAVLSRVARPFTNRYAGKGSGRLTLSSLFFLSQQVVNCGSICVGVNC